MGLTRSVQGPRLAPRAGPAGLVRSGEAQRADMGETRAGDRTRTGDLLHGKQTLYQLSYARALPSCPHRESNPGYQLERLVS